MSLPTSRRIDPRQAIIRKRDGAVLSREEIQAFVHGASSGDWADYQLSAMLMAICIRGMDAGEGAALTEAIMHSGVIARLDGCRLPKVDKHSTGGVGDKISLPLAPLVAACGVAVPMISGRGLGHTGGTLDKLESIPGFRVRLSMEDYVRQMESLGVALIGQTDALAPADRKLYSLRDVTGTVESIPLICASILGKKLAEGIDALVLDVKFGRGAFMRERSRARELARTMVEVAVRMGKPTRALLTNMDRPLGRAVGNALEVAESLDCLKGRGPADVMELTLSLGVEMLLLAGRCSSRGEALVLLQDALDSGRALDMFGRIIEAQGGDARVLDDPSLLPRASEQMELRSERAGYVIDIDPMAVALACLELGAGRRRAEDSVNPSVGVDRLVQPGEWVDRGAVLARIHASDATAAECALSSIRAAIIIGPEAPVPQPLVCETIG